MKKILLITALVGGMGYAVFGRSIPKTEMKVAGFCISVCNGPNMAAEVVASR